MTTKELKNKISDFLSMIPKEDRSLYEDVVYNLDDIEKVRKFKKYLLSEWLHDRSYVFRLPYAALPENLHQKDMISMQQEFFSEEELDMEFNCIWRSDSTGPYKASSLEHCTDRDLDCELVGKDNRNYFIGIDPGQSQSKFAVVVLKELATDVLAVTAVYQEAGLNITNQLKFTYKILNSYWPVSVLTIDIGAGGHGKSLCDMLNDNEDKYNAWGNLGSIKDRDAEREYESESTIKRSSYILERMYMSNQNVTDTNDRMIASIDAEKKRLLFSGSCPDLDHEDIYLEIEGLKTVMTKLIRKIMGNGIKYDLPGKDGKGSHNHDNWSALTCAYWGYMKLKEFNNSDRDNYGDIFSLGDWDNY